MAAWVNVNRAAKFPEVMKVYKKGSYGQGAVQAGQVAGQSQTTGSPTSAPRGFLETVRKYVQDASLGLAPTLPAWIRLSPTGSNDWQDCQVDVTAIPGVRKLRAGNGKWANF
jgi:hypothetical protein